MKYTEIYYTIQVVNTENDDKHSLEFNITLDSEGDVFSEYTLHPLTNQHCENFYSAISGFSEMDGTDYLFEVIRECNNIFDIQYDFTKNDIDKYWKFEHTFDNTKYDVYIYCDSVYETD